MTFLRRAPGERRTPAGLRPTPAGERRASAGLHRILAGIAVGALGALAAFGLYAEATQAPDQP